MSNLLTRFTSPLLGGVLCFTSKSVVILLSCKCGGKGWGLARKALVSNKNFIDICGFGASPLMGERIFGRA